MLIHFHENKLLGTHFARDESQKWKCASANASVIVWNGWMLEGDEGQEGCSLQNMWSVWCCLFVLFFFSKLCFSTFYWDKNLCLSWAVLLGLFFFQKNYQTTLFDSIDIHCLLRARRALSLFSDVSFGTRRVLNCCTKSMAIAPFWFSTEHHWIALKPFWFSADDTFVYYSFNWILNVVRPPWFANSCVMTRAVLFRLFPKMVNLPPKPVGFRLTFIQ